MTERYATRGAFVLVDDDGRISATADEILLPVRARPRKTGLVDQYGEPIYRLREAVPFGFRGPAKSRSG